MNEPIVVTAEGFQEAYLDALARLRDNKWSCWNLNVQVANPLAFDRDLHARMIQLADAAGVKRPKDVSYTIFPEGVWRSSASAEDLYDRYMNRFYPRVHRRAHRWGTYFARMVAWRYRKNKPVNQLQEIIRSINESQDVHKAAYSIVIPRPGGETRAPLGAPCLSLVTLQLERSPSPTASLLAVYRSHDFLGRAYGNYWGLCQLLGFIADQTGYSVGRLTCLSSRAFVDNKKTLLRSMLDETGR